jgi:hypothetical protein
MEPSPFGEMLSNRLPPQLATAMIWWINERPLATLSPSMYPHELPMGVSHCHAAA